MKIQIQDMSQLSRKEIHLSYQIVFPFHVKITNLPSCSVSLSYNDCSSSDPSACDVKLLTLDAASHLSFPSRLILSLMGGGSVTFSFGGGDSETLRSLDHEYSSSCNGYQTAIIGI